MYARPIRSSLGTDANGSTPVCTGPSSRWLLECNALTRLHNFFQKTLDKKSKMQTKGYENTKSIEGKKPLAFRLTQTYILKFDLRFLFRAIIGPLRNQRTF